MKKIMFCILAAALLFACNNEEKEEKKISSRNYGVTTANSYNNLFLDSMDVINYINSHALPDSVARRIISFYNARNYEFAWLSSDGLSEQALGFSSLLNLEGDTSAAHKKLEKKINNLMVADDPNVSAKDSSMKGLELQLTEKLIHYTKENFKKGYVKRKEVERFIPIQKEDPLMLADSLLGKKHKDDKYFADINKPYKLLMDQLKTYVEITRGGKWMSIEGDAKSIIKNGTPQQWLAIKNNLFLSGDMNQDTVPVADSNLAKGLKNFQRRFGLTEDGKLTDPVLKQLNMPPLERVKMLLINMNRMRWLPQVSDENIIVVNTPAFILSVFEGTKKVLSMPVVVGKEGHNTTLFSDFLTTIVFSPYWNIPPSIVKNEILPGIQKNPNYLARHDMEVYGQANGLPEIRQRPGGQNSLGKVKFLFPNSFNIYFHDTPAKSLFQQDARAYSHGCIRLSEPAKMAAYLLRDQPKWTTEKINEAMNSGKEQFVSVKKPVPVFITYYTAWVDDSGLLNFRDDIYGHDQNVASKMFISK